MLRCGLLGEKLGHSYSPQIHRLLADYEYRLYELSPDGLAGFIKNGEWDGLNVTIPYKKAVLPFCDELSPAAARTGSVNTLVRRGDRIFGDNTDVFGFERMLRKNGVETSGKKALILGNGGVCPSVRDVLGRLGASTVVVSRRGENNYGNLERHRDAALIVNATPVGMYPSNGNSPVELTLFPDCAAVLDLIYNPARTALLMQAQSLGMRCGNGLHMLVAQAKLACELFTGESIPDERIDIIEAALRREMLNLTLIGMPGCGKTTVARLLGALTGREVIDTDELIERRAGISIPEIFSRFGERDFRRLETEAIAEAGKRSGCVIATGGGCVTVPENLPLLRQNSTVVWLRRDIAALPADGRPVSQRSDIGELYHRRAPLYEAFADILADNDGSPRLAAQRILDLL